MRNKRIAAAVGVLATLGVVSVAGCSSSGTVGKTGAAGAALGSGPATSAPIPPASSAPTATATTPPPPRFTADRLAAAFRKPADLGKGWKDTTDKTDREWASKYRWGCEGGSQTHEVPTAKVKRVTFMNGGDVFTEQTFLFGSEDEAVAAQAVLEKQPRDCVGTHRVQHPEGGETTNDTYDFETVAWSGFSGVGEHVVSTGVTNGFNESLRVEMRDGPLFVIVYYDLFGQQDPNPAKRHADFVTSSKKVMADTLGALADTAV